MVKQINYYEDFKWWKWFYKHDGVSFKSFSTAQDHKRVLEGDKGNTGGMGVIHHLDWLVTI